MRLTSVDPKSLTPAILGVFDTRYPLLTAGDRSGCNTMTIGWCQLGCLWRTPVCTVYVRPERYTYEFMESHDYFTVSVLPANLKETLMTCGTKSGRDLDKVRECGLTVAYGEGDAPYFEEAEWVLVCKKIYAQDFREDCVTDRETVMPCYGKDGGWHRAYTGKVVEAYHK